LERLVKNTKKHLEIICFIPKCLTNFKDYQISFNYIIQTYYRLKKRKNHETLDFEKCGKEKAMHIFLSFLSLFHSMEFSNNPEQNLSLYSLSLSDEKKLELQNNEEIIKKLYELSLKVKLFPYKFDQLAEINEEIKNIFEELEKNFPQDLFESTVETIEKEILECKFFNDLK